MDTCVIFNGLGCDVNYTKQLVKLLREKYTVLSIEFKQYFDISSSNKEITLEYIVRNLQATLPDEAIYIGWSFGGLITLKLAELYPHKVKAIIGLATTPKFLQVPNWPGLAEPGFLGMLESLKKVGWYEFFRQNYKQAFSDTDTGHEHLKILLKCLEQSRLPDIKLFEKCVKLCQESDLRDQIRYLQLPYLLLAGADDELISKKHVSAIDDLNDSLEIDILENVGHLFPVTHPELVADKIVSWLTSQFNYTLHHHGYSCFDIDTAIQQLQKFYKIESISEIIFDELQNVHVCLLKIKGSPDIELVSGKVVENLVQDSEIKLYHLCYEIFDIDLAIKEYEQKGAFLISAPKPAKLFDGRRVAFLQTTHGLIELLEKSYHKQHKAIFNDYPLVATYTVDNLVTALNQKAMKLDMVYRFSCNQYRQIVQKLINKSSMFNLSHAKYKLILLRFDDIYENNDSPLSETLLNEWGDELIKAISYSSRLSSGELFVFYIPTKKLNSLSLRNNDLEFQKKLRQLSGIKLYILSDHTKKFNRLNESRSFNEAAHIVYDQIGDAILSDWILRSIHSSNRQPYKVIAIDCDNTLWSGVCSEGEVLVTEACEYIQNFILEKKEQGFLLAVCSKNSRADVEKVFEHNQKMILKVNDFISFQVNWRSKSVNIEDIAKDLGVSLSSFIFIDDSSIECKEMEYMHPEISTLNLPSVANPNDLNNIENLFDAYWPFDVNVNNLTAEDRRRTVLYEENNRRQREKKKYNSLNDFIYSLNIRCEYVGFTDENMGRAEQLVIRTNQFNLTCNRSLNRNKFLSSGSLQLIKISDKYGGYGVSGLLGYSCVQHVMYIEEFILSCRVLGRGVEFNVLSYIIQCAERNDCHYIEFRYSQSKNEAIERFLLFIEYDHKESMELSYLIELLSRKINYEDYYNQRTQQNNADHLRDHARDIDNKIYKNIISLSSNSNSQILAQNIKQYILSHLNLNSEEQLTYAPRDHGLSSLDIINLLAILNERYNYKGDTTKWLANYSIKELLGEEDAYLLNLAPEIHRDASPFQLPYLESYVKTDISWPYNMPYCFMIKGELNIDKLMLALSEILMRSESLRTYFSANYGKNSSKDIDLNFEIHDYSIRNELDIEQALINFEQMELQLETPVLYKFNLFMLKENQYVLQFIFHHSIFDGYSFYAFTKQLEAIYGGDIDKKYVSRKNNPKKNAKTYSAEKLERANRLYSTLLKSNGLSLNHCLELDDKIGKGEYLEVKIDKDIKILAEQYFTNVGANSYCFYLMILQLMMAFHANNDRLIIGCPMSRRNGDNFYEIGCYVNTLLFQYLMNKESDFSELLKGMYTHYETLLQIQDVPLVELSSKIKSKLNINQEHLFDILYIYQDAQLYELSLDNLSVYPYKSGYSLYRGSLSFEITEHKEHLTLGCYYPENYDNQVINSLLCDYVTILKAMLYRTAKNHREMSSVLDEQYCSMYSIGKRVTSKFKTLSEWLLTEWGGNNTALLYNEMAYSYDWLKNTTISLAEYIQLEVGNDISYAIIVFEQDPYIIASLFSCILASIPFMVTTPSDLDMVVNIEGKPIYITKNPIRYKISRKKVINPTEFPIIDKNSIKTKVDLNKSKVVCYAYTSGTTSDKKKIAYTHENLINMLEIYSNNVEHRKIKKVIQYSSVTYDAFYWELLTTLFYKKTLVLPNVDIRKNVNGFSEQIQNYRVDTVTLPAALMPYLPLSELHCLKNIIFAGSVPSKNILIKLMNKQLYNAYGLAETTICLSINKLGINSSVNDVGSTGCNNTIIVCGHDNKICLPGIVGNIFVAGTSLSPSLKRLTSVKLKNIKDKVYNTNDVGYFDYNGHLRLIGRSDQIVKVGGQRVDVDALKNCVLEIQGIIDVAICIKHEDNIPKIHIFLVIEKRTVNDCKQNKLIRLVYLYIKKKLSEIYYPNSVNVVDDFIYNDSGKMELKWLMINSPGEMVEFAQIEAISDNLKARLQHIWKKILNLSDISDHDSFFDLGGNSLKLIELQIEINREFNIKINPVKIYENYTLYKMEEYLSALLAVEE